MLEEDKELEIKDNSKFEIHHEENRIIDKSRKKKHLNE